MRVGSAGARLGPRLGPGRRWGLLFQVLWLTACPAAVAAKPTVHWAGLAQFDSNWVDRDPDGASAEVRDDEFFRRLEPQLNLGAYGWSLRAAANFASLEAIRVRDLHLARRLGPGRVVIGQFKPYRGMEELNSSAKILFMERPAIGSGLGGHEYAIGLGYKAELGGFSVDGSWQGRRSESDGSERDRDQVLALRSFSSVMGGASLWHLGGSLSRDRIEGGSTDRASLLYAGRVVGPAVLVDGFVESHSVGLEAAWLAGPWSVQAEGWEGEYRLASGPDERVQGYYGQAAWWPWGPGRRYVDGALQAPESVRGWGALELKIRYEFANNRDRGEASVESFAIGANWHAPGGWLCVLEAIDGRRGAALGEDQPQTLAARLQWSF